MAKKTEEKVFVPTLNDIQKERKRIRRGAYYWQALRGTIAVLVVSALATIRNRNEVTLFDRNISKQAVNKAVAVIAMSFGILFVSTLLLSAVTQRDSLDVLYETVSATATVGLTRDLTPRLNSVGKAVIIGTMYLGRVGPISLALALNSSKKKANIIKNPTEEISVG